MFVVQARDLQVLFPLKKNITLLEVLRKKQKSAQTSPGGGAPVKTILEQSLGNRGRKRTAGVVKRKEAGVEKSRNRAHCGAGEE